MKKKISAVLLACIMICTVFAFQAFAADESSSEGEDTTSATSSSSKTDSSSTGKTDSSGTGVKSGSTSSLSPYILLDSYSYGGSSVAGGSDFTFSYRLKNTSSTLTVQNIIIKVSGGEVFSLAGGTDTTYTASIAPGATVTGSVKLNTAINAESGPHPVQIDTSFEYYDQGEKGSGSTTLNAAVNVSQTDRFSVSNVGMGKKVYAKQDQNVTFTLTNTGNTSLKNVYATVTDASGNVLANAFYGSVEASAQTDDAGKLTVNLKNTGEQTLTLKIDYEDKLSNKKEYTEQFTVNAVKYTNPYDVTNDSNTTDVTTDTGSSSKKIVIYIVVGAAVIAAIIIIIKVIKKKKAAKKASLEQEL
jgi:hypothetical protein